MSVLSEPLVATKVPDRDIYLIVLDRYGSGWSIGAPLRDPR